MTTAARGVGERQQLVRVQMNGKCNGLVHHMHARRAEESARPAAASGPDPARLGPLPGNVRVERSAINRQVFEAREACRYRRRQYLRSRRASDDRGDGGSRSDETAISEV